MHAPLPLLLLLIIAACTKTDAPRSSVNAASDPSGPPPELAIATAGDEPLYRVSGVGRVRDDYFVLNGGSSEVLEYGQDGSLRFKVGRQGDGPAEFRRMRLLGGLAGDTLAIMDDGNRRITLLCDSLRPCGEIHPGLEGTAMGFLGPDLIWAANAETHGNLPSGIVAPEVVYTRITRTGETRDTLLTEPGTPMYMFPGYGGAAYLALAIPFTTGPRYAAGTGVLAIVDGRTPTVHLFDGDTDLTFDLAIEPIPVTDEDYSKFVEDRISKSTRNAEAYEKLRDIKHPEFYPPIRRLVVDSYGRRLWVELEDRNPDNHTWLVTDFDGNELRRIRLPDRFRLYDVANDRMVGVWRDSLDVEFIHVHRATPT